MKKLLLILAVLLFSINMQSQNEEITDTRQNEIGIVVTDLLNGAFQFRYERLVGEHISVSLGIGYKGKNGLIRLSGLDTESIRTDKLTYSGLKIIPEVRYYFHKDSQNKMDGFYVGFYVKHSSFNSDLDGTYINSVEEIFDVEFDAKLNITSAGFMAGYKLAVSPRFTIDFLIAGPGAGFHSYSLTKKKPLPSGFYDDINDALSQYSFFDFIGSDFDFRADDKSKTNFSALSFRYGISVGYSF